MVQSNEVFKNVENPDLKVKEVKSWLGTKGGSSRYAARSAAKKPTGAASEQPGPMS